MFYKVWCENLKNLSSFCFQFFIKICWVMHYSFVVNCECIIYIFWFICIALIKLNEIVQQYDLKLYYNYFAGIMAILFCGIVMSHYTHYNLSTVTQITMQQTMRTLSFIAETCVFAYLGLAIFSFRHRWEICLNQVF